MSDSNDRKNVVSSEAPWVDGTGIVVRVAKGLKSLMTGMRITGNYFVHPSTVVTQQYPDNRATLQLPSRFRAHLAFNTDTDGYNACTVCRICEDACPNRSIIITQREKPAVIKKELDAFVWRMDTCTFCNACVIACPFGALTMSGSFEAAVYDRRLLTYNLNRYAGPPASVLQKTEDPEQRLKMMEPRGAYSGPVPLGGGPAAGGEGKL
jgi:NADH-quinone oxidoreductase subunit I